MKTSVWIAATIAASLVAGCKKDKTGPEPGATVITASGIDTGGIAIDRVDAVPYPYASSAPIASAPFVSGGFSLTLPAWIDDAFLYPASDDLPDQITLSDPQARWAYDIRFDAYAGNVFKGHIVLGKFSGNVTAHWFYADRKFSATGATSSKTYDYRLEKGWNCYAETNDVMNDVNTYSSTIPDGVSWRFETPD